MTTRSAFIAWTTGAAILASGALAQSSAPAKDDPAKGSPTTTTAPRTKPVRKPVVDLEKMAKERRPGQVMPGDPTPVAPAKGTVSLPEATPATPPTSSSPIGLPDTSPSPRPTLRPSNEAPTMPPAPATPAVEAAATPMTATDLAPAPMMTETVAPAPAVAPVQEAPMGEAVVAVAPPPPAPAPNPAPAFDETPRRAEPLPHVEAMRSKPKLDPEPAVNPVGLVDKFIVTAMPMAVSTSAATVRVESISGESAGGGAQWRTLGAQWRTPIAGETTEGRLEVRAGLDAEMVLIIDDRVQVRITRLGRATIERAQEPDGSTTMSISLTRGAAEIRTYGSESGNGQMFARVKTPDQVFGLTGPLRVEYDAFTGTRRRTVNP